jgi:hypothetical protein
MRVVIKKEWSMKFGQNLFYVAPAADERITLAKVSSRAEAIQFAIDNGHILVKEESGT